MRVFERHLFHQSAKQGLFPVQEDFLLEYADFYAEHVRNLCYPGLIHSENAGTQRNAGRGITVISCGSIPRKTIVQMRMCLLMPTCEPKERAA